MDELYEALMGHFVEDLAQEKKTDYFHCTLCIKIILHVSLKL